MTNLYQEIKQHQLQARKEKNKLVSDVLSVMLANADSQLISRKSEQEQHQLMTQIVQSTEKQLQKSIQNFKGKMDISGYEQELKIVQAYLPKKLTEKEIYDIFQENVQDGTFLFISYPEVMKYFSAKYKGQFDANLVKNVFDKFVLNFNGTC